MIVADIDDNVPSIEVEHNIRPRRANAGAGVERIQMDFHGKGYGAKREFNFLTNGDTKQTNSEHNIQDTYMQMACNVIFTQMNANKGIKKYGEPAVAAMIKEPVVVPIDANTITNLEKSRALEAVNLIMKWSYQR